jgi:hypothetical protein
MKPVAPKARMGDGAISPKVVKHLSPKVTQHAKNAPAPKARMGDGAISPKVVQHLSK